MTAMRRIVAVVCCCLLTLPLSSCWSKRELDELAIVSAVGLDFIEETEQFLVVAQIIKPAEVRSSGGGQSGGGGGGGGQGQDKAQAVWVLESAGDTVFEAMRNLALQTTRRIFLPHIQAFIFSRKAAQRGVAPFTDFLLRDVGPRDFKPVFVTDAPLKELMQTKFGLDSIPAVALTRTPKIAEITGRVGHVPLHTFRERLMSKTGAPTAGYLELVERGGTKQVYVRTTAIFKGDKLVGRLDELGTRGMLWVEGKQHNGIVNVSCPGSHGKASLETVRVSSELQPTLKDGRPGMTIKVEVVSNLGGQSCLEDLTTPLISQQLSTELASAVQEEMQVAVETAQALGADIFGFGGAFERKLTKQWKEMEQNWDQMFTQMPVEYKVLANVRLRGLITRPPVPEPRPIERGNP